MGMFWSEELETNPDIKNVLSFSRNPMWAHPPRLRRSTFLEKRGRSRKDSFTRSQHRKRQVSQKKKQSSFVKSLGARCMVDSTKNREKEFAHTAIKVQGVGNDGHSTVNVTVTMAKCELEKKGALSTLFWKCSVEDKKKAIDGISSKCFDFFEKERK